ALPRDREALEALARRLSELGAWRELADVLARQTALFVAVEDRAAAAEVALARATLLEDKLNAPGEAAVVLDEIIAGIAPASVAAHERRVRLAGARGETERAIRLLERAVWLARDPAAKMAGLEQIGRLASDPRRALQAWERLLEIDPHHVGGLVAAAELHKRVGQHAQHVALLERLAAERQGSDQQQVYLQIAHAVEEELGGAAP